MSSSDTAITTRTKMALATDERVGVPDIQVETIEGVVILRGQVESMEQKQAAAEVAAQVEGVREVHNDLTVRRIKPPSSERLVRPHEEQGDGEKGGGQ